MLLIITPDFRQGLQIFRRYATLWANKVHDKFHTRTLIVLIFMILTDKILHIDKDQSNQSNQSNQFDQYTLILSLRWKFVIHPTNTTLNPQGFLLV